MFFPLMMAILAVYTVMGCGSGIEESSPVIETTLQLRQGGGEISSIFLPGQTMELTLTVTNLTNSTQRFTTPDTQTYEFMVVNSTGVLQWLWGESQSPDPVLTQISLGPNESIEYVEYWELMLANGTSAEPGFYNAQGFVRTATQSALPLEIQVESEFRSSAMEFELK